MQACSGPSQVELPQARLLSDPLVEQRQCSFLGRGSEPPTDVTQTPPFLARGVSFPGKLRLLVLKGCNLLFDHSQALLSAGDLRSQKVQLVLQGLNLILHLLDFKLARPRVVLLRCEQGHALLEFLLEFQCLGLQPDQGDFGNKPRLFQRFEFTLATPPSH